MNNGPLLFLGILVTLGTSFWGLLLAPRVQLGAQQPQLIEATGEYYPPQRPGQAARGADIYRSLGCVECHTQQTRQTGVHVDVWVTELATNVTETVRVIRRGEPARAEADLIKLLGSLPARYAARLTPGDADILVQRLSTAGVKAELGLVVEGADIERGWGRRMTVAQDYLQDYPVQLGQVRLGPDLANYGARQTNRTEILKHLYNPQLTMPGSIMPPYRFLFTEQDLVAGETVPENAVVLTAPAEGKVGRIAVPKESANELAAYLMSLRAETPLFEAPVGKAPTAAAPAAPAP
jgi:cbb3-type cytochrome oxidase cytochrome c subunit